jgi:hypothetical protein
MMLMLMMMGRKKARISSCGNFYVMILPIKSEKKTIAVKTVLL